MMCSVDSASTRCSDNQSARRSSSALDTACTPAAAARSGVSRGLQAMTSMPMAWAISAMRWPSLPRPTRPSVRPASDCVSSGCQRPSSKAWRLCGRRLASASISAQASSAVAPSLALLPGAPQTVMPRRAQAAMSMEALRMPVVTSSFRSGRASSRAGGKGVRSRIATITW
ncbi:hypothetical protein D3C71_1625480 [compost metagenome]